MHWEDNLHYEKFQDGTVKCIEDEIPFEVPEGWMWSRLKNISFFQGGYAYKSTKYVPQSQNQVIRIGNVRYNKILCDITPVYVDDYYADDTNKYRIFSGDILFTMTGTKGKRDYFYSCMVRDDDLNNHNLLLNQRVGCLKLYNNKLIFAQCITVFLQSQFTLDSIFATETGNVNQGNISSESTMNLLIPILPTGEQERIITTLDKITRCIDIIESEKRSLREIIEQIKTQILNFAISGQLIPQDPNDESASVLLERIRAEREELIKHGKIKPNKKESIIYLGDDNSYYEKFLNGTIKNIDEEIPFTVPDDWSFCRLSYLWELISGRDLNTNEYNNAGEGIPYITGASNFNNGVVNLVRWTDCPQVITIKEDLLLTCKGTIGEIAINTFGEAHIARQVMAIRNFFSLNTQYLELCIRFYINKLKYKAKGLIPGISREDILTLIIPVPPEKYQLRLIEKYFTILNIIEELEVSLN